MLGAWRVTGPRARTRCERRRQNDDKWWRCGKSDWGPRASAGFEPRLRDDEKGDLVGGQRGLTVNGQPLLRSGFETKLECGRTTLRLLDAQIAQRKKGLGPQKEQRSLSPKASGPEYGATDREMPVIQSLVANRRKVCASFGGVFPGAFYGKKHTKPLGIDYQKWVRPGSRLWIHREVWASGDFFQPKLSPVVQWRESY